jgi:beta-lactamase class A
MAVWTQFSPLKVSTMRCSKKSNRLLQVLSLTVFAMPLAAVAVSGSYSTLAAVTFATVESAAKAQTSLLSVTQQQTITDLLTSQPLTAAMVLQDLQTGETFSHNADAKMPLMSVFKLPLGVLVLRQVAAGTLQLDQQITVQRASLLQNTWSPMLKLYPAATFSISVRELLELSVAQSDNNACDLLFSLVGGPAALQQYLQQLGLRDVQIELDEKGLHQHFSAQYQNWISATAAASFLRQLANGNLLPAAEQKVLWQWLVDTPTGKQRIKAGLPAGAELAHKTGTGGSDDNQLQAAINDIGIVTLANGKRYALVLLFKDITLPQPQAEALMAEITRQLF